MDGLVKACLIFGLICLALYATIIARYTWVAIKESRAYLTTILYAVAGSCVLWAIFFPSQFSLYIAGFFLGFLFASIGKGNLLIVFSFQRLRFIPLIVLLALSVAALYFAWVYIPDKSLQAIVVLVLSFVIGICVREMIFLIGACLKK